MALHVHRLDAIKHQSFLAENRSDPFSGEPFRAGAEIVICAAPGCHSAWLKDSWRNNGGKCVCGSTKTLAKIPDNHLHGQRLQTGSDKRQSSSASQKQKNGRWSWAFWLQWIVVNTIAWCAAIYSAIAIAESGTIDSDFVLVSVSTGFFGLIVGFSQWLVLRARLPKMGGWFFILLIGGSTSGIAVLLEIPVLLITPVIIVIIGQWILLSRRVRRHFWWPIASIAGCGAGVVLMAIAQSSFFGFGAIGMLIFGSSGGFGYALISGGVLGGLLTCLKEASPKESKPQPSEYQKTEQTNYRETKENKTKENKWSWAFWLQWIVMNTIACGAASHSIYVLSESNIDASEPLLISIYGGLFGLIAGVSQWLVLRTRIPKMGWWILLPLLTLSTFGLVELLDMDWLVIAIVASVVIGQWFLLSRRVKRHYWWPIASIASGAAGAALVIIIGENFSIDYHLESLVFGSLAGFGYAFISGGTMGGLLTCLKEAPSSK